MNRWFTEEIRKANYHKKRYPTFLEARSCGKVALLPKLAGTEKDDSIHASKDAGSVTHSQVW